MERILDANLNRGAEALRVLEECARFSLEDAGLAAALKDARHRLCNALAGKRDSLLAARDTQGDIGAASPAAPEPRRELDAVVAANCKRLQQALRVLAEYGADSGAAAEFERLRYESYTFEKNLHARLLHVAKTTKLATRRLYLVTNSDAFPSDDAFFDAVEEALVGGVDILQLREKKRSARDVLRLGERLRQLCDVAGALFIVNDRVDLALALKADGVHVGQDDMDIATVRKILPPSFVVGVSTHEPAQARAAHAAGADYIGVGPIFATPTKPGRPAAGLDYARWVAANIPDAVLPAFAIGGITEENSAEVLATGVRRLAVVRAIINAGNPSAAAQKFCERLAA